MSLNILVFFADHHIKFPPSLPPPSCTAFHHDGLACHHFPRSLSSRFCFQLPQTEQLFWWGAASTGGSGELSGETWILPSHPGRGCGSSCDCSCDLYYTINLCFTIMKLIVNEVNQVMHYLRLVVAKTINCCGRGSSCDYSNLFLPSKHALLTPHTRVHWRHGNYWSIKFFRVFWVLCHYAHEFICLTFFYI